VRPRTATLAQKYLDDFTQFDKGLFLVAAPHDEKEIHLATTALQAAHSHLPGTTLLNPNLLARNPHHSYHDTEEERRSHPNY